MRSDDRDKVESGVPVRSAVHCSERPDGDEPVTSRRDLVRLWQRAEAERRKKIDSEEVELASTEGSAKPVGLHRLTPQDDEEAS